MSLLPDRPTSRRARLAEHRAITLGAAAAASAAGFGALARASSKRKTAPLDEAVHAHATAPEDSRTRRAAQALAPIGKWWTYMPAALGAAAYFVARPKRKHPTWAGALAVAASGAGAWALARVSDEYLPQPPAPPGHEERDHPVFPSGHTLGPSAVALTTAYVLVRERRARGRVAVPVAAVLPLATASLRLVDEKHWASDIIGGYVGGMAIAATCLAGYEVSRR